MAQEMMSLKISSDELNKREKMHREEIEQAESAKLNYKEKYLELKQLNKELKRQVNEVYIYIYIYIYI